MPRRYVFLLAASALWLVLLATPGQGNALEWLLLGVVVALVLAYFSAVRDIIANPRLELERKVLWVALVLVGFPLAVPAYIVRHGMPWQRAIDG